MGEKRVRKGRRIIVFLVIIVIIAATMGGYFMFRKNDVVLYGDEEYVSVMSNKDELELEEMFLKDLLGDLENRGLKYEETDDRSSEQYGFNLVFNIVKGDKDYCQIDEYREHDLTKNYCELKNPKAMDEEGFTN